MARLIHQTNNSAFEVKRVAKKLSFLELGELIGESKYNLKVLAENQIHRIVNGERAVSYLEALEFKRILGLTNAETIEMCKLYQNN